MYKRQVFGVATATVMLVARSLGEGDLEQIARLRKQSYCLSFVFMLPIALGIFFGSTLLTLSLIHILTERDYFKDPGLDHTLTGDGLAQIIAGFFGAPPVTSYGENIGVMALSKVYSVYVISGAAVIAVVMSFIGKLSALLHLSLIHI